MIFHWPQIVWCVLVFASLLICAAKNGERYEKKYNFPMHLMASALVAWLLYMGGFFAGASP